MSPDTTNETDLPMNDYGSGGGFRPDLKAMQEDVIVFAANTILRSDPRSFTAYAAIRVLDWAVKDIPSRPAEGGEAPGDLAKLADMLREIVVADPDGASRWVGALRAANSGIARLHSPEKWTPSKAQIAAAMRALDIDDQERIHVMFDTDGHLVARPVGVRDNAYRVVNAREGEVTS